MSEQKLIIQLAQVSQSRARRQYLPYAAGLLQAHTLRHASDSTRYTFLPILFLREPVVDNLKKVLLADVIAFSAYVWNIEYSLALARAVKAQKPETLTIFGGPQVPDRAQAFLEAHPEVDVCCHGEGEEVFLDLLESLPDKDWSAIGGISWRDEAGQFHTNPQRPRKKELDEIPSPYLMGIFDDMMQNHAFEWTMLWETNRGCPFSCTFCDWGSATAAKVNRFGLERLKREMDWMGANQIEIVNCCDANFGIFPRDVDIAEYAVQVREKTGAPKILFIQGVKNATERSYQIQKKIIDAGMGSLVTLALQSVTPRTLKSIRRENISLDTYRELQHRFQKDGVNTYTDMLVGLPGETYDSFADGVDQVIREGQNHLIQFFNVYILPNAELAQPAYREEFGIRTVRLPYSEPLFPLTMEVQEWHEMVIGTHDLNPEDWRRVRVFAWWVEILYLHRKIMQIPILIIHHFTGISFRDLFEFYVMGTFQNTPLLSDLNLFLHNKARAIQEGEIEFCALTTEKESHWLTIPNYVFTGLRQPQVAEAFYADQFNALQQILEQHKTPVAPGLLKEILNLSRLLFLNFYSHQNFDLTLNSNFWEVYKALLRGDDIELKPERAHYRFQWTGPPHFDISVQKDVLKPSNH